MPPSERVVVVVTQSKHRPPSPFSIKHIFPGFCDCCFCRTRPQNGAIRVCAVCVVSRVSPIKFLCEWGDLHTDVGGINRLGSGSNIRNWQKDRWHIQHCLWWYTKREPPKVTFKALHQKRKDFFPPPKPHTCFWRHFRYAGTGHRRRHHIYPFCRFCNISICSYTHTHVRGKLYFAWLCLHTHNTTQHVQHTRKRGGGVESC